LQSEFDVLTEAGYKLEVQSYNLEELVEESPAWKFTEKLQEAKRGQFWYYYYSHQTDLLRYLILFKWGGVYMDTDVIIVRPVDSLRTNVIAYEDPYHKSANGAFIKFEKGNLFIKECLEDFPESYSSWLWAGSHVVALSFSPAFGSIGMVVVMKFMFMTTFHSTCFIRMMSRNSVLVKQLETHLIST